MSNDPEWLADARQTACDAASAKSTAEVPVMDLRRLTREVLELNTRIRDLLKYVDSVRENLATHERVLGQIGAYEATASDD